MVKGYPPGFIQNKDINYTYIDNVTISKHTRQKRKNLPKEIHKYIIGRYFNAGYSVADRTTKQENHQVQKKINQFDQQM